jgi:hypothetical protein
MAPINILGAYTRTGRIHREKTLGETNVNCLSWPNNVEFKNKISCVDVLSRSYSRSRYLAAVTSVLKKSFRLEIQARKHLWVCACSTSCL